MTEIIGLSGYARAGKDEAARVLVEEYGFTRVAFADKLREFLHALNPPVAPSKEHGGMVLLQEVIDTYTWDNYKATEFGQEIRRQLQRLGTEAGRKILGENIWVDAALTGHPEDAKIVVTDARFPNEAEAIKSRGGQLWRISRAGIGPAVSADGTVHSSETSLDDWIFDWNLFNDTTLENYQTLVRDTYEKWASKGWRELGYTTEGGVDASW